MEEKRDFKVTEKEVNEAILTEQYFKIGNKTTICLLILNTGYEVVGTSAPVDPENFDFDQGKKYAKEKAVEQVWCHLGSIVQWQKAVHDQEEARRAIMEENYKKHQEAKAAEREEETEQGESMHVVDSDEK